ncbi:MAG: DUF3492 domain-containing protein, partial [Actinomycetota bacterium]
MDVHLVAEGTYPFHLGGVSVWCDQLIRGIPDRHFGVSAISATGRERPTWEIPGNLVSVRPLALWGEV